MSKTLQCADVVDVVEMAEDLEVECLGPRSGQDDGYVLGRLFEVHVEGGKCARSAQVWTRCKVVLL